MTRLEITPRVLAAAGLLTMLACGRPVGERAPSPEAVASPVPGRAGGRLVATLRAEPGTLNPLLASDRPARTVRYLTTADLIHINRSTQRTEAALAESWSVSEDGMLYTLRLRRGVRFSDGEPFDADDVLFSFKLHLDPAVGSPNRSLLTILGEPIRVEKVDSHTVTFELAGPYAAGERIFDSVAIVPEHLLAESYGRGDLTSAWGLGTPAEQMAVLGPYRPSSYRPGDRLTLERNPHYWRTDEAGQRLPYLDELVLLFLSSEDAEAIRFQSGEVDIVSELSAENFAALEGAGDASGYVLEDLGASLAYNFLFFNLNDLSGTGLTEVAARQEWFRQREFRRAVSEAVDREAVKRLVYKGRATTIGGPVSDGNRLWRNEAIVPPVRSIEAARKRLAAAGFSWDGDGRLRDAVGRPVEFTIVTNSSSSRRVEIASIVQEDLRELGVSVQVAPLEFRTLVGRLLESHDYDACILGLSGGDVDPNSSLPVWLSSGANHLWAPAQESPTTPWEAEIDVLMTGQMTEMDPAARKRRYDRVQEILAEEVPLIWLVSQNVLAGADRDLGNFRPAVLEPNALWNVDELFWKKDSKNLD